MHRRQFGLLSLGTAAATTGVLVMLAPARAQETALPRSIAQLPPDLRGLMAQSFAKFSDAEYARRERLLGRQPIIGSKSRPAANQQQITLRENMCMVVQPNVITRDKTAGVQT